VARSSGKDHSAGNPDGRSLRQGAGGGGSVADISEGDLRAGLRGGGRITGVIVVARPVDAAIEYTPYLLLSWHRGYHRIARWRGGERRWREFDRVLRLLRELGWADAVPVYDATDPKLLRVRAIARLMGVPPVLRRKREPQDG